MRRMMSMPTRNKKRTTSTLILSGILAAVAVVLHIAEGFLPPLTALPGIKLGLANSVVVFAAYYLDFGCAAAIQAVRILTGSLLSGQVVSAFYSIAGGLAALAVIRFLHLKPSQMWGVSAFAAIANSIGQIIIAFFVLLSEGVFAYLPYMIIASIIAGAFTGFCAQAAYMKLRGHINEKE